jgi:predicted extracellular nuclease
VCCGLKPWKILRFVLVWIVCLCLLSFPGSPSTAGTGAVTLTSICAIQGDWFTSPFEGKTVQTRGVVFADFDDTSQRGLFLQDADCDADPATSDGIFVYLGDSIDVVQSGDLVEVGGEVKEYYGMTEISASPGNVMLISSGNPLPPPVDLTPPFDQEVASRYFESLEGMYVAMGDAAVVGPTSNADETWVVRSDLGITRVFQDAHEAKVGDQVMDLEGALEYSDGAYRVLLIEPPILVPGDVPLDSCQESDCLIRHHVDAFNFTLATFNLANLFDTYDDPDTEDTVLSVAEYQRRLKKRALAIHAQLGEPAILAVQEAEDLGVLQDLVSRPEIEADYDIVWQDGPDFRGIDIALLYRTDLVKLLGYRHLQGCTKLLDGLGPDGNRDMTNPQNEVTCDTDADGILDGNRLFSRPPLVIHLKVCPAGCSEGLNDEVELFELKVIVNHWKSKLQDSAVTQYTLPRRIEQAQFVADLVRQIRSSESDSHMIILGDLNDYPDSEPLTILKGAGLLDLTMRIPKTQRYTFIHHGVSQVLDYILYSPSTGLATTANFPLHINTDYPAVFAGVSDTFYRCSDHDPLMAFFTRSDHFSYLPLVSLR